MSTGWIVLSAAIGYVVCGLVTSRFVYFDECWKRDPSTGKLYENSSPGTAFWSFVLWPLVWLVLGLLGVVMGLIKTGKFIFEVPVRWWYTPTAVRKERAA